MSFILDDQGKSCGWRCPACQFVEHSVPNAYRCFCGLYVNESTSC